ncbi:MAG: radical SAM protein [bacterium]|nr:MAG: radical SAM protein [bacterium]
MGIRIFLGNAPWGKPGYYGVRAGSRWPHFEALTNRYMPFPFQLAYTAAVLERDGHDVLLVDGIAEGMTEDLFHEKAAGHNPDLVILEVSTPSFNADIRMAGKLRSMLPPAVRLAFAGPHAPMASPDFLRRHPGVDYVLVGEYELTAAALARALENSGEMAGIQGLVYRNTLGAIVSTGKAPLIEDLDSLPWPARHFLPMKRYFDNPGDIPEPAVQMWASRGCAFSCTYCIWPQIMDGNRYRTRDIGDVLDEIRHVMDHYGARSIYFDDDTFNIGRERMLRFCHEKVERGLDVPWAIMARADLMDEEILQAMAASNLQAVKYGIESADPDLLKNVSKGLDLEKAIRIVEMTKKFGIKVHLTFMFGIPGETRDSIRRTVRLARDLAPDSVQFSLLTPLPGTRIYEELMARGHLLVTDWSRYDGYSTAVIRTESLTAEDLETELARAWRSWFRHRALRGLTWRDVPRILTQIPNYLRHPRATINQFRSLFHV